MARKDFGIAEHFPLATPARVHPRRRSRRRREAASRITTGDIVSSSTPSRRVRRGIMANMDEYLAELRRVIGVLNENERFQAVTTKEQCVAMRMAGIDLTRRETALATGMSEERVKKVERRALAKLRETMDIHRIPDVCVASRSAKSAKLAKARGWKSNELKRLRWHQDKVAKRAGGVRSSTRVSDDAQDD